MEIEKEIIEKIEDNWKRASRKFDFEILCPCTIKFNHVEIKVFAFLPHYGSGNGIIIDLISPPQFKSDNRIVDYAEKNKCGYSFINVEMYLEYNEDYYKETLKDWGHFKI